MKQQPDSKISSMCRWAVLVGINHYAVGFPALRFCVSDATEMQAALTAWPDSGYTTERIRLLIGNSEAKTEVSRSAILQELDNLVEKAGPEDQLLFYFAGHGEALGNNDVLLIPSDARPGRLLPHTAVSLAEVKRLLMLSQARSKIIILDACYTGVPTSADTGYRSIRSGQEEVERAASNVKRLAQHAEGLAILHAGSRSPVREIPELGHGLFTHFLLRGLRGEANTRADTVITVTELYEYVRGQMDSWANSHDGQAQHPTYELAGYGDLALINVPGAVDQIGPGRKPTRRVAPAGDALLAPLRGSAGFVGRSEELRRILQMIATTSDMALLVKGEPGIGKTSLINRIKLLLDDQVVDGRAFRYFSIEPSNLTSLEGFAREIWQGVRRGVDSPEIAGRTFSIKTFDGFGADLEVIRRAAADTTFVVFMDEFDKIIHNKECTELERTRIRGLINYLVVSTSFPIVFFFSVLQDLPKHYGSAVPTLPLMLHVLSYDETAELAHGILAGYFSPDDAEVAWLYEYCGGHPYLTRLVLAKLLEQMRQDTYEQRPSLDMWEEAAQAAVESGRAKEVFGSLYESYLDDDQRYALLWFAAHRTTVITVDQAARLGARLRLALRELARRDYLAEDERGYRIRISMLRDWLIHEWPRFELEADRLGITRTVGDEGRTFGEPSPQIPKEGVCVDLRTQRVYVEGQETQEILTDQQYRGLVYLAQRVGQVVSGDELAEHLWPGEAHEVDDQRIAQVIHRIRLALGDRQKPYRYLETRPKRGYCLHNAQCICSGVSQLPIEGLGGVIYTSHGHKLRFFKGLKPEGQE
jgi:DNA-binding winged helix-turn-helix (wHTH) protein